MSMFQSPTGVANFVDPSQVNGKLNSSFSWTDAEPVSPTLKTPSKKKKKATSDPTRNSTGHLLQTTVVATTHIVSFILQKSIK
mmetsp:Transcript_37477/g.91097  ORF Transcript_37477/g.91097 Transcript_37477/m.91097 type:complete len:83 (+) Transcript_37477:132-380(+)